MVILGNLHLYEAIELRNEYDRHIGLLQGLLGEPSKRRGLFNDDDKELGLEKERYLSDQ